MRHWSRGAPWAAGALVLAGHVLAVPPASARPERAERPTYALKLEPSTEIATGRIAMVQAEAGADPDHYIVENLTILQPVEVLVVTRDPSDEVKVQICKVLWDQPEREASTKGTGSAHFAFRSEGDVRIKVSAPAGPRAYQLVVWAGDEARPPMRSPFVSMDEYRKRHGSAGGGSFMGSLAVWVIAGALVVIAALLGVVVMRGRRT
jgi:hypothetical protein